MTEKTWLLHSKHMERELHFDPAAGLVTRRWLHRLTGTDFIADPPAAPNWNMEFSFAVNRQPPITSRSPHLRLISDQLTEDGLEIGLATDSLQIAVRYTMFADHPVIRKGLAITNTSDVPITLSHVILESLELRAGSADEQRLMAHYGVLPRELFMTGRMDDPALYQFNVHTGEGWIAMNEAPGILKRIDTSWSWQCGVQIGYDTDIFPFERRLEPGETFTTAQVGIAFVQENTASAPQWVMPAYTSAVLLKKGADYQPAWIYNTWEHFFRDIDEPLIESLIPIAGQMGYDIFTLDDGWQARMGEDGIDTAHFPNGLDTIREQVEAAGMRLGLWLALAVVGADAAVAQEHPEWICLDRHLAPRQTFTMSGFAPVMCLASPYRQAVIEHIAAVVERYHLAYIKLDLTTVFNTYGETPGCYAEGHEHHTADESLGRIYEGIKQITDALYARFPDLLIDLTFELWGQKHLIDYGLLAAGDLDWMSNVHDLGAAGPRQARTLLYHRARVMPVEAMLIGNLQANIEPIAERFATAIGSGPLLSGDLRQLSPDQVAWYGRMTGWYKRLRRELPIQESFLPLGAWMQPNAAEWDGFARLSWQGEGIVVLFGNQSAVSEVEIRLPLFTDFHYRLFSVMAGTDLGIIAAEQLRGGVLIPLTDGVQIVEMRRV